MQSLWESQMQQLFMCTVKLAHIFTYENIGEIRSKVFLIVFFVDFLYG